MGPGLKNRQAQTAARCKEHLRATYRAQSALVEEFIIEIEGVEPAVDPAKWGQFTDPSRSIDTMLKRLDSRFNQWLNGDV
ncbi:MAG: hypothetical protein PHQ12_06995 [Chthoniobacteraceae bacterium]|nr:hypothetical protein [Chthoniobacteraceae bacterium]